MYTNTMFSNHEQSFEAIVIYIRRFIYKFLNVCPFDYTAIAGRLGP